MNRAIEQLMYILGSIPQSGQLEESVSFSRFFRNSGVYNVRNGAVKELPVDVSINGFPRH